MKTSKLFAGVALAALTAACTQESMQFEPTIEQQDRPMVNVELGFDESAIEALATDLTREYYGDEGDGHKWHFEDGDRIGGLLMDEWDGVDCGIEHFNIVNYVHTNYAFIRETKDGETSWVTPAQAPVCEGNYFFYFPYNDTFNHRGYVAWDVNPIQPQYNEDSVLFQKQTLKENQKWIGYKYVGHELEGKVNKINFAFVPLFAEPTFDIINRSGGTLIVEKMDVRVTSNDDAVINPSGTHDLMATTMMLAPGTKDGNNVVGGNFNAVNKGWEGLTRDEKTAKMYAHAQRYTRFNNGEDYVWPTGINNADWSVDASKIDHILFPLNENHSDKSIRKEATYKYTADFSGVKGGYKVDHFGHIRARLVMPAGYYYWNRESGQTFEALIYVTPENSPEDKYVVRIDLGRPQTQGATNGSNFDDAISGAAPKFLAPGKKTEFYASFDATAMQSYNITDFKVTSTDELAWLISESEENQGYYDLNVTTSGKRVVLDKTIEDLLAARPKVRLHVNGEITIGGEEENAASSDAINKLYFNNRHMKTILNIAVPQVKKPEYQYNEGDDEAYLTDKSGQSYILSNCEINVKNGGSLDTKTNEIYIVANVNNDGTVTAKDIKGEVVNNGTMEAEDITGPVINNGKLTAASITDDNSLTCKDGHEVAVINNAGDTLTVSGTIDGAMCNWGTATAKTVTEALRNMGTMTVNNAPAFSNKSTGTMNFVGTTDDIVSGSNGAANRGGVINVTGTTEFAQLFNDGAKLNINADVTFTGLVENGYGEHKFDFNNKIIATINIAKDKTVKVKSPAELRNSKNAVINVEGNLGDNIKNSGEVFVKGQGQFIANGIVSEYSNDVIKFKDEFTKGIIDVTDADGTENDAQKAMDLVSAETGNAFRYVIKSSTDAASLNKALYARISSKNITTNDIIIVFNGGTMTYYGALTSDTAAKVTNVLVNSGTTLTFTAKGSNQSVEFDDLKLDDATQVLYKAVEVQKGAKLIVADYVTVKFNSGIEFFANGEVNVNDHATLTEGVTVQGVGKFWNSTANNDWTLGSNWTGEDYGF